jgi:hypothetical protein
MSIRRTRVAADHFTIVPNDWLRDDRLSWKARGLLGHLLSHQEGWEITIEYLVAHGADGRDAVRSGIAELEEHGYLIRHRVRNEDGTLQGVDYILVDPTTIPAEKPTAENPTQADTYVGEPATKKTTSSEEQVSEDNGLFQPPPAPATKTKTPRISRLNLPVPDNFEVSDDMAKWATAHAPNLVWQLETEKFLDYHRAKGSRFKDWASAWRTWIRKAEEFRARDAATAPARSAGENSKLGLDYGGWK